jgi:hypothetical protein
MVGHVALVGKYELTETNWSIYLNGVIHFVGLDRSEKIMLLLISENLGLKWLPVLK